jgi:hypothetical protein
MESTSKTIFMQIGSAEKAASLHLRISGFSQKEVEFIAEMLLSATGFNIDTSYWAEPLTEDDYYSVSEIAAAVGLSARTVRKRAEDWLGGKPKKKGKGLAYPLSALPEEWQYKMQDYADQSLGEQKGST